MATCINLVTILFIGSTAVWAGTIKTPLQRSVLDQHDFRMHYSESDGNTEFLPKQLSELDPSYWLRNGGEFVHKQLQKQTNRNRAKNIIMFLGDGMSTATIAATRMYMGGEEKSLFFEDFPHLGMAKTYCVDYQVPDSACTSTAYLSGVKANYGTIGVTAKVSLAHCEDGMNPALHTSSIAKWAIESGKVGGVVTTTRITHASPAGVYAHAADRDWENNDIVNDSGCNHEVIDDIAEQLIDGDVGSKLRVLLGGGRREFRDKSIVDEEGKKGKRTDGKDLIQEWLNLNMDNGTRQFIWNREELINVDASSTDYLLGLFEHSHMRYNLEVKSEQIEHLEPTLSEMVEKAIEILSKHDEGFFLFVEGGLIDRGHHDTKAHYALEETVEFAKAVALARNMLSEEDTLIVTTADHSHTMTYAGYANRGNDILGSGGSGTGDNIPYMTLSYANGLGYHEHVNETTGERINPLIVNSSSLDYMYPATVPLESETHGGDDVVVYASGPWSHLFAGTFEQNVIPYIMAYAGCVGNGPTACDAK